MWKKCTPDTRTGASCLSAVLPTFFLSPFSTLLLFCSYGSAGASLSSSYTYCACTLCTSFLFVPEILLLINITFRLLGCSVHHHIRFSTSWLLIALLHLTLNRRSCFRFFLSAVFFFLRVEQMMMVARMLKCSWRWRESVNWCYAYFALCCLVFPFLLVPFDWSKPIDFPSTVRSARWRLDNLPARFSARRWRAFKGSTNL